VYAPPTSIELDDLQNRLHHYFELGTVFTMIAGLLNILAIYDAWGGPVIIVPREKKRRVAQTDQSPSEPPPSPTKTVEEAASGG